MATGRLPDPNTAPLTAKGDLYTYSTVPAKLAVGNNGDTLLADSSQSLGLRWGDNLGFTAGKNKIINGDFRLNQRAFTSTTTNTTYGFDRFYLTTSDGTTTYSAETFTPGTAPVSGYEAINFARLVSTGQTLTTAQSRLTQPIEDVRTFAGRTVTVSFWAKASTGTPNIAVNLAQNFGSGGSTGVVIAGQKFAITDAWVRYSKTFTVPSISGKTIGTSSFINLNLWISAGSSQNTSTDSLGIQSITVDFWGVQAEAGSVATAFQTATGTLQGELAACQRYYYRQTNLTGERFGNGKCDTTTAGEANINFPVTMRTKPTALEQTGTAGDYKIANAAGTGVACSAVPTFAVASTLIGTLSWTVASGAVAGNATVLFATTNAYLGWSAEL